MEVMVVDMEVEVVGMGARVDISELFSLHVINKIT
jgi:hypothetical protein